MTEPFAQPAGATPLTAYEMRGLKPGWIVTRANLDEAEQTNILRGLAWSRRARGELLSEAFAVRLNKAMFGDVWRWAGTFRQRETNIGHLPHQIRPALRELLDTARCWRSDRPFRLTRSLCTCTTEWSRSTHSPTATARHTRLMADLLVEDFGGAAFTWGRTSLVNHGPVRATYIAALRAADQHDIGPLLAFARS